jgi:hypothetical protein
VAGITGACQKAHMGRMKSAYEILPEGTRSFGRHRRSLCEEGYYEN